VSVLRLLWVGWRFHIKSLTLSGFFLIVTIFAPALIATIAYYMFKSGHRPGTLFYASLGSAVYGIWSSTLFGSGGALAWQRWQGTLEVIVSTPTPLLLIVLPLTIATSSVGLYSLASTLLWGRLVFGIPFQIAHPLAFALAVPVTILGLGLLGVVLAATFILYRHANALSNMLEWPVLLVTGLLVPLSLLPGWSHPIAWVLAPTWGVRAVRAAALGGNAWPSLGLTLALGAAYLVLGALCLRYVELAARRNATLSLT
jgi:ABC-2 type transport system permease protein